MSTLSKIGFFLAGSMFTLCGGALAASAFTDIDSFASWYKQPALNMQYSGIMQGYPDGSFRGENTVNRAELAVILDRFRTSQKESLHRIVNSKLSNVVGNIIRFHDEDISPLGKSFIILAESGLYELDGPPEDYETHWWEELDNEVLPEEYSLYIANREISGNPFFLRFSGIRIETDVAEHKEQWYGPFYLSD